ncbi:MAG: F0F1 ATP synthase subunit epsilon [Chromatiales bacterium]|nr:F0F1 ATP synthase subunit epsilon [Chromatiales bacterium]
MSTIRTYIVSAEEEIFSGEVNAIFAEAELGEVGIYPQHAPFLSTLRPGEIRVRIDGQDDRHFYVSGGVIEVQPHIVTILTDTAMRGEDLEEARALEAKQRAEELLQTQLTDIETAKTMTELAEIAAQLRMIERLRKRGR